MSYVYGTGTYTEGERYSPFDVPVLGLHRGHGLSVYEGINNGCHSFRCDGCGDNVFYRDEPES